LCSLTLGDPSAGLADCLKVLSIAPGNKEAAERLGKCAILLGDVEHLKKCGMHNLAIKITTWLAKGQQALTVERYMVGLHFAHAILQVSPHCLQALLISIECLIFEEKFPEAVGQIGVVRQRHPNNPKVLYLASLCSYHQENWQETVNILTQLIPIDQNPKNIDLLNKSKKIRQLSNEGKENLRTGKLEEAMLKYEEALTVDPEHPTVNAKFHFNLATIHYNLEDIESCLEECDNAIEINEGHLEARHRRAVCYMDIGDYGEAAQDFYILCILDPTNDEWKDKYKECKKLKMGSSRKDYYGILGVTEEATLEEIKKGYKAEAFKHHPDKHTDPEAKEAEEILFKEITEAYKVLTNEERKWKYDNFISEDDGGCGNCACGSATTPLGYKRKNRANGGGQ